MLLFVVVEQLKKYLVELLAVGLVAVGLQLVLVDRKDTVVADVEEDTEMVVERMLDFEEDILEHMVNSSSEDRSLVVDTDLELDIDADKAVVDNIRLVEVDKVLDSGAVDHTLDKVDRAVDFDSQDNVDTPVFVDKVVVVVAEKEELVALAVVDYFLEPVVAVAVVVVEVMVE